MALWLVLKDAGDLAPSQEIGIYMLSFAAAIIVGIVPVRIAGPPEHEQMLTHILVMPGENRKRHSSQHITDTVIWTQPYTIPRPPARVWQEEQQQDRRSQQPTSKSKTQSRDCLTITDQALDVPASIDENHNDKHNAVDAALLFGNDQPFNNTSYIVHDLKNLLWLGDSDKLSGYNALHLAAYYGQASTVRLLLKTYPADVNLLTDNGQSALHIATAGLHINVVVALLDYEADLELQDNHGRTPLHVAVLTGAHAPARLLVDRRLECLHMRDMTGCTPLHVAVMLGHDDIVRLFLGRGADRAAIVV
ncbi:hypothetical protein VE02_07507 [Pseudogymnoascus sp. 03VT05]|nr:hypothetical protein VE02_07507 [Pseudogymnoascus sp. 03VT05]